MSETYAKIDIKIMVSPPTIVGAYACVGWRWAVSGMHCMHFYVCMYVMAKAAGGRGRGDETGNASDTPANIDKRHKKLSTHATDYTSN